MKLLLSLCIGGTLLISPACTHTAGRSFTPVPQQKDTAESVEEIASPAGYSRVELDENSFGAWLKRLALKTKDNTVYLYNGQPKANQGAHFAILQIDVGTKDLQQCADAAIRLRAEYLYSRNEHKKIRFNFTSGDTAAFEQYAEGWRPVVKGNKVEWVKSAGRDYSYPAFRRYLDMVFTYAGTLSLAKELVKVGDTDKIMPGDVFIRGGSPGHAVIVIDVAEHSANRKKIFTLAQSYMPAQEIHILKNPAESVPSPWYSTSFGESLPTPEWTFEKGELMRWKE